MRQFKPWEWLILQQRYFARPRRGLDALHSEFLSFSKKELEQGQIEWAALQRQNIRLLGWQEKNYPKLLKEIYDPPLVLQAQGDVETLNDRPWIAVVGTRKASRWGKEQAKDVVTSFVKQGCGIISGLAYGIDAAAHQAALDAGGPTWGVLGSSLDRLYPVRHAPLASHMEKKGGGLLSEFPLGTRAEHYHFPQRNRIISGMAQAVVIIEAAGKSGSLITARYALEQGREVFVVVPPSREDPRYEGNWRLLNDGATPIGDYGLRTTDHGLGIGDPELKTFDGDMLSHLQVPCTLDHLLQKTKKPVPEILTALTKLESLGKVRKLPGPLWQSL
ncbi:MAG: DNA-protecting protein DprA [Deltaproteobacteria bacterium]|nr:DNA-protecting protein DprA [Deltaproteobacteria bacterium]